MTPRSRTRVALVEDHALFAESLDIVLSRSGYDVRRIELSHGHHAVATLVPRVLRAAPHVVLLDLDLAGYGNGARLVEPLAREGLAVVVVTGSSNRVRWGEALHHGARSVLPKSASLGEITCIIRRIEDGLAVTSSEERAELLALWDNRSKEVDDLRLFEHLTAREAYVLGALMNGLQVSEVAQRSVVSEATVRTQVKSVLAKLGVSSQLAAVGLAHRVGWWPPE